MLDLRYVLATPPAVEPISLADVHTHLRIDDDDTSQDATLNILIAAAREYAEKYTGRCLIDQSWKAVADGFPSYCEDQGLFLKRSPVKAVTEITYIAADGSLRGVDPATYVVDTSDDVACIAPVYGARWPQFRPQRASLTVKFTAGYGANGATVPPTIRNWMLVRIATAFDHREAEEVVAKGKLEPLAYVDGLLDSAKVWWL
jgi:uncharacterized phiE125 gp8 family phage protein